MELDIRVVDIRDVVSDVMLTLQPQLAERRLDSVADIPPDVRVEADPGRLRAILLALLTNAIRFTEPRGHVMVDVGYPEGMRDEVVMLRVGDSGCGMSRAQQDTVFDAPQTPSSVGRAGERGSAPGLPLCRAWAREMGGDIRVRSDEGSGSVFTLTLPHAP